MANVAAPVALEQSSRSQSLERHPGAGVFPLAQISSTSPLGEAPVRRAWSGVPEKEFCLWHNSAPPRSTPTRVAASASGWVPVCRSDVAPTHATATSVASLAFPGGRLLGCPVVDSAGAASAFEFSPASVVCGANWNGLLVCPGVEFDVQADPGVDVVGQLSAMARTEVGALPPAERQLVGLAASARQELAYRLLRAHVFPDGAKARLRTPEEVALFQDDYRRRGGPPPAGDASKYSDPRLAGGVPRRAAR